MRTDDFILLCDGLKPDSSQISKPDVDDKINILIKELYKAGEKAPDSLISVRKMRRSIIYLSILDDSKDYRVYYDILDVIVDHSNWDCDILDKFDNEIWGTLISTIKHSLDKFPRTDGFIKEDTYHHARERARAAKRLISYGVSVSVEDGDLVFKGVEVLFDKVDYLASKLGGIAILQSMVKNMPMIQKARRLLIPYQGNKPMPSMVDPETPWGYIFNICQKHICHINDGTAGQKEFNEFRQLTQDIALALFDAQKFDYWEDLFHRDKSIIQFVRTLINRHVLYSFPQCSPSFAHEWCRCVAEDALAHKDCDDELCSLITDYMSIEQYAYDVAKDKLFYQTTIQNIESYLKKPLTSTLANFVMIDANKLNTKYKSPDDYDKVNGWKYPLVRISENDLLVYPASIGSWNWYEALLLLIKSKNENIINDIGYSIERFIFSILSAHNIDAHTGNYSYDSTDGECDILIESTWADFYLECKKKVLTAKAKKGNDLKAWEDIAGSLIESQYQCSRTEYGVKKAGNLTLYDKTTGNEYTYIWRPTYSNKEGKTKERHVERITLTLNPFGFMQDGVLVSHLLEEMMNKTFHVDFAGLEEQYSEREQNEIKAHFEEINSHLAAIQSYNGRIGLKSPFFFSRFLDLEKLYFMVNDCNSNDEFCKKASKKHVTFGTQDFWLEYFVLNQNYSKCTF